MIMKALLKNLLYCGLIFLAVGLITSCSDDESNDPYDTNYVYTYAPGISEYSLRYKEDGTFIKTIGKEQMLVPARCTKPAPSDLTITFAIDNSLVDSYNKAHGTDYVLLKNAKLENTSLTIKKGEYISAESLKVIYADMVEFTDGTMHFILPITITEVKGGGVASSDYRNFFLTYESMLVTMGDETAPTGNKIEDRTGWTISKNGTVSTQITNDLTDGDTDTDTSCSKAEETIFVVNLGKEGTISSIGLTYYANYYSSAKAAVATSLDGSNYTSLGDVDLRYAAQHCLNLYTAKEAQYLKITLSGYWNSIPYLNEINVYTAQ